MTPPARLPVAKVIWGAFALPAMYPAAYFQAVGQPLLTVIGATLLWLVSYTDGTRFMRGFAFAVYLLSVCWLAIRTHRLVLLGEGEARPQTFADARKAISKYFVAAVGGWLAYVVGLLFALFIVSNALFARYVPVGAPARSAAPDPDTQRMIDLFALGASVPLLYLLARVVLVLPAIALGQKPDLRAAWERSRGNGWRLFVVTMLLPRLFRYAFDALGVFATNAVIMGIFVVLIAIVASLEVIALSLSYRELAAAPAPPPTAPPA